MELNVPEEYPETSADSKLRFIKPCEKPKFIPISRSAQTMILFFMVILYFVINGSPSAWK